MDKILLRENIIKSQTMGLGYIAERALRTDLEEWSRTRVRDQHLGVFQVIGFEIETFKYFKLENI